MCPEFSALFFFCFCFFFFLFSFLLSLRLLAKSQDASGPCTIQSEASLSFKAWNKLENATRHILN
ncbi:hypothetical protein I79_026277 [Cricetulus griseus]|uniref:Uncharacterized protein n=1 Tax=Cricetulus griseus TaxID=10029 RepID=G3IQE3_CRIGR|nr:hypothetical protein I79_026277 [Cricetulus griseus]